jgi:hypothetical protein
MFARPSASTTTTPNIMLCKPLVSLSKLDVYVLEVLHYLPLLLVLYVNKHVVYKELVPM